MKTVSFTLYLTSYNPPPPLFSLSPPSERVKVVVTQGDITDYSSVLEVSKGADLVIHTASLVDVWHRVPETVIQAVNVQGKGSDTAIAFTGREYAPIFTRRIAEKMWSVRRLQRVVPKTQLAERWADEH